MKLKTAQVSNYRCIEDSEEFHLDPVTCLVGKNESGKTSILTALHALNPLLGGKIDKVRDYPRRFLADYGERHVGAEARVVRAVWELDDADRHALAELVGPPALTIQSTTCELAYGGTPKKWDLAIDEAAVVTHLLTTSTLHQEERDALVQHTTVKALKAAVDQTNPASERHNVFKARLATAFGDKTALAAVTAVLETRMPKMLYFAHYDRMPGQIALNDLKKRQEANQLREPDQIFLSLCDLAGAPLSEVASINQFEPMLAKFEAASNKITAEIFEYWTQNRYLEVQFRRDGAEAGDPAPFNEGYIFRTRIVNQLHKASLIFDERSAGFVWFFSFLVMFSQVKKRHGTNLLILLDEPGLNLHAKAQSDLQRFVKERLAPHHQVVYTTHSPFMVPTENLLSVRTVEDVIVERPKGPPIVHGTKVRNDVLRVDADTLFPLQGALGYEITQSLFVGKNALLVEGPSDLLYLRVFSQQVSAAGGKALDPRWTICPVGGLDKVGAFLGLFGGNNLHVAVLVDVGKGQKRTVQELEKLTQILRKGNVLTLPHYAGQAEADIEDLLGAQGYVELVNAAYGLTGATAIAVPTAPVPRIVKYVEAEMRTAARATLPEFDHYRPAEYLAQNRETFLTGKPWLAAAVAKFETAFSDLNALLQATT